LEIVAQRNLDFLSTAELKHSLIHHLRNHTF
jgi:hypothetical protein